MQTRQDILCFLKGNIDLILILLLKEAVLMAGIRME